MGTIAASVVIADAASILLDSAYIRWSQAEHLRHLNDAQREIAVFKPTASVRTSAVAMTAGTKQSLPTDGLVLIDVVCNTNAADTVRGRAVRVIPRELLDTINPDWHSATVAALKHYVYDVNNPKTWWAYPPAAAGQYAVVVYGAVPTVLTAVGDALSVDDIWVPALTNYLCYRAYAKDSEFAANGGAAAAYYQQFLAQVGAKQTTEQAVNPGRK